MIDKIKAIRPQIIVTGTVEKPYYEILYYDTSDNVWHIGYSSYNLANVVKWKEEFFEVVGEIEDMQSTADVVEVVRCKDCKHRRETLHRSYCLPVFGLKQITDLNASCSYGERRDT